MKRAAVIGSGPNGLVAAIVLAQAGLEVEVFEEQPQIGGGVRTADLTLPGFRHDVCSAIHPFARASFPWERIGVAVDWVESPAPCAHPLDDGTAVTLERDLDATAAQLGPDADAYRRLVAPVARGLQQFFRGRFPFAAAPRTFDALRSARSLVARFADERTRAFFAGQAAHSVLPLERPASGAFALVLLGAGHAVGWPFPRGGAQAIAAALAERLRDVGGVVHTSSRVDELPHADIVVADVMPRELLRLARFTGRYERALRRYRHTSAAFKLDWALDGPIPWRADECRRAATVHVGGSFGEIAESERGKRSPRPFVLLAQHTLFDATRAPAGKHTAWAYCHVPNGSRENRAEAIEAQIERFAPGFRDLILARSVHGPSEIESDNRNCVGGDINGGTMDIPQLLFRPAPRLVPWRTPRRGLYVCSAATPPGGGVHGLSGYAAAKFALRDLGR